jgi:hypothetical protein
MINIRKEITNPRTLYRTKAILYRTRTEKGLEAYEIMKRLVYVAYRIGGHDGFINYDTFLNLAISWLDWKETIYDFMDIGYKSRTPYATIFGINVGIVVNGTYGQIEQQLLNKRETLI